MDFENMVFPYTRLPGDPDPTLRPLITARLTYKEKVTPDLFFLLDSGSDYTYVDYTIGIWLGINFDKIKPLKSLAANRQTFVSYPMKTNLSFEKHQLEIPVLYTRNFGVMGLLGQEVFFDYFKISFERYRWQIELTPKLI